MAPPSSSNNKKRSAPSSGPQGNKKPRFAPGKSNAQSSSNGNSHKGKSDKPVRRGGQNVTREPKKAEPEVKRKAPITGRKYEEDLEEEDDVDMDDLDEDEFDEEDIDMADGEEDGEEKLSTGGAEGVDGEAAKRLSKGKFRIHPVPTHFNPELIPRFSYPAEKAALHAQQPHRTTLLPSHPLLKDTLLPLWEDARRADLSKEERNKKIKGLYEAVKGRVREVGRGHKGGRVLQTVSCFAFLLHALDIELIVEWAGVDRSSSTEARRSETGLRSSLMDCTSRCWRASTASS
jgi:pumilio family protein 6